MLETVSETAGIEFFLLSHFVTSVFFFFFFLRYFLIFRLGLRGPRLGPHPPRSSRAAREAAMAHAPLLTCSRPFLKAMPGRPVACDVGVGTVYLPPKVPPLGLVLHVFSKRQDGSKGRG